jgi:hypothetical protein
MILDHRVSLDRPAINIDILTRVHCPAPSGFSSVHHHGAQPFDATQDYNGPLMHHDPASDGVVMTRLQIALQREIAGWPLYTIILALGQVSFSSLLICNPLLTQLFERCWVQRVSKSRSCLVKIRKIIYSSMFSEVSSWSHRPSGILCSVSSHLSMC